MNKLLIGILFLCGFLFSTTKAFLNATVNISPEDRELIEKTAESFKSAIDKLPKAVTQGGVVFISSATAALSIYALFLVMRYEFSRQPNPQEPTKVLSWKSQLAGAIGTAVFAGSILALFKSSTIADYAIKG